MNRLVRTISQRLRQFGYTLKTGWSVIPARSNPLFVRTVTQHQLARMADPDGSYLAVLQDCIRREDVRPPSVFHTTRFHAVGTFKFGGPGSHWEEAAELWAAVLADLDIPVTRAVVHPNCEMGARLWKRLAPAAKVALDSSCQWEDNRFSGPCCRLYSQRVYLGCLASPALRQGSATVTSFGLERLAMLHEKVGRVDQSSMFPDHPSPIVRNCTYALDLLWGAGVSPGPSGREAVCRKLLRRMLPHLVGGEKFVFGEWINMEQERRRLVEEAKREKLRRSAALR